MCPVEPVKVEGARVEVSKKIKDGLFDSGPESFVERGTKAIRAGARMHVHAEKSSRDLVHREWCRKIKPGNVKMRIQF